MDNTLEAHIIEVLNVTKQKIRDNMQREGVNASGRTSDSIRVEKRGNLLALIGGTNGTHTIGGGIAAADTAPIPTLEVGRKGGGNPPVPKGFYYIIREWSRVKGISFATESERNTFAYFLSRKIADRGTDRYEHNKNIYSTPVMEAKQEIRNIIGNTFAGAIRNALTNVHTLRGAFAE